MPLSYLAKWMPKYMPGWRGKFGPAMHLGTQNAHMHRRLGSALLYVETLTCIILNKYKTMWRGWQ
jgi:hypothetical protein